ncbi:Zn(2+)-responsive transcriptional regulator [Aeromonas cavernicola]|uniref:Zn(2+)-responsive transcriptional regulator n=1 Tax=Aeromonas cavernicola TaxID=1006623 RepID=A0A2H9U563_9GAMM|nr:Zn(2+)-responsive transcriptional regulator [Aeromonas cavernicola]PJG59129.1 Zn(2+)-responsive transcriptional regulator [Aeromonas cavernicola]
MYRIGELAKVCGVKADTLRFYEKNGLIAPSVRNESGYRLYSEQDKRRLEFIIRAKSVGFSLADIGELLDLDTHKAKVTCQEVKAVADSKLAQVEQKLSELSRFRDNLRELSNICCGGPRSAEHCAILEVLESGTPARHEQHAHE